MWKNSRRTVFSMAVVLLLTPSAVFAQSEIIDIYCPSCGYRAQFVQGANQQDLASNVQQIIVVCERTRQIRSIKIAVDPKAPVRGVPLLARQYGTGRSEVLGLELPKFLVPGNTCPLFPFTAYVEANICPVNGGPGIAVAAGGQY